MKIFIRRIEHGDFDEWLRMRMALWPTLSAEGHRAEMDESLADPTCATFVAIRSDGRLGGFLEASQRNYAEGCTTSPVGYIEGWYVYPDLRNRGIGGQLVRAAESWARVNGLREIASDCDLDNQASLSAHLALDFEEVERLIHFRKSL